MDVVTVGTLALDDVETPFGRVENALGGSGVFFSIASGFFAKSGIVGVVGRDFPKEHLDFLGSRGIDLSGVESVDGKTFHWAGSYEYDMNAAKTLKTDLNVLADFDPKIPSSYKGCGCLFLANIDPCIQLKVLDEVKPEHCLCDTMNFWIDSKKDELTEVFERVDGIIINEAEAREYCGTPNLVKAGRMLSDIGDSKVVIKKGEHGALYFGDECVFALPGFPTMNVVDPTGAGDSFAGGLVGHLAKHGGFDDECMRKSIVCGTVIASYVIEGFSVEGIKDKTIKDVQERYEGLKELVAFD
ncbi:PfkB family carbohydrate kinase [Candidatus Altiarchaeota archaeon]